jgi:hypothetical protein
MSSTSTNAEKSTACAVVYTALTPDAPRPTNNVSRKGIERCTATVNSYYTRHLANLTSHVRMPQAHNLDNVFLDGRLDNSPFDLMIDIYRIKQKMFSSDTVKAPPTMIMYDMPSLYDISHP